MTMMVMMMMMIMTIYVIFVHYSADFDRLLFLRRSPFINYRIQEYDIEF